MSNVQLQHSAETKPEEVSRAERIEQARQLDYYAFLHRTPYALDAYDLGYTTGVREDYTLQQASKRNLNVPVSMLDNDFHDPDIDRWVAIFEKYQPDVGVIADAFTREEARKYTEVATELHNRFPDSELIIVPKCDCFDIIPEWVVLGYASGGGDTQGQADLHPRSFSEITDWRGRRVHVLGGSPPTQWDVIRDLTQPTCFGDPPADVVGADYNGAYFAAESWFKYWHHETPHWRREQEYEDIREVINRSLEEIRTYWEDRGVWPESSPIEQFGPAVLTPDDPVLGSSGTHYSTNEDDLHHGRGHIRDHETGESKEIPLEIVEYEDGTTLTYEDSSRRAFVEYRGGVIQDHGEPVRECRANNS